MSVEVYFLHLKNFLDRPIEKYLHLFSDERREKILRYKFLADRNRTVWAELSARSIAAKKMSRTIEEITIVRDEKGKPYLLEGNLKISLSHSKNWAAVSIGETESGVDVEENFEDALGIAKNFFPAKEYLKLRSLPEEKLGENFLKLWTLKESYFKMTGIENFWETDCEKIPGKNFILPEGAIAACCANPVEKICVEKIFCNNFLSRAYI